MRPGAFTKREVEKHKAEMKALEQVYVVVRPGFRDSLPMIEQYFEKAVEAHYGKEDICVHIRHLEQA